MKSLEETDFSSLASRFHLEFILLFGSQISGLLHKESDIDIAVLIDEDYRSDMDLLALIGAFMQLLKTDRIDLVCLNDADYFLRYEVTQHCRVLYEARQDVYLNYACAAMKQYEAHKDLERLRENVLHEQIFH